MVRPLSRALSWKRAILGQRLPRGDQSVQLVVLPIVRIPIAFNASILPLKSLNNSAQKMVLATPIATQISAKSIQRTV